HFVRGEARVPIDAKDRLLRKAYVLGSKFCEFVIQAFDKLHHWSFDQLLILLLARLKPFTFVVLCKDAQKLDCVRRESGKFRFHRCSYSKWGREISRLSRMIEHFRPPRIHSVHPFFLKTIPYGE